MTSNFDAVDRVLICIRQITRAIDLHSKKMVNDFHLTVPQLILLREIERTGQVSMSRIAKAVNLSNATVTNILERLERRGMILRHRSERDKRVVLVEVSGKGLALLQEAPPPLQECFVAEFQTLKDWEQSLILSSLQRIADMMNAATIDAAPLLSSEPMESNGREDTGGRPTGRKRLTIQEQSN